MGSHPPPHRSARESAEATDPHRGPSIRLGALLAELITHTDGLAGAERLLHREVTLVRIDGTTVAGRTAVVDAVVARGSDARLRVTEVHEDVCDVALEMPGLEGHFPLQLAGTLRDGLLFEIRIEPR